MNLLTLIDPSILGNNFLEKCDIETISSLRRTSKYIKQIIDKYVLSLIEKEFKLKLGLNDKYFKMYWEIYWELLGKKLSKNYYKSCCEHYNKKKDLEICTRCDDVIELCKDCTPRCKNCNAHFCAYGGMSYYDEDNRIYQKAEIGDGCSKTMLKFNEVGSLCLSCYLQYCEICKKYKRGKVSSCICNHKICDECSIPSNTYKTLRFCIKCKDSTKNRNTC